LIMVSPEVRPATIKFGTLFIVRSIGRDFDPASSQKWTSGCGKPLTRLNAKLANRVPEER
jgi:hypothetical protein